ncbi:MAG: hypothetical protein KF816_17595, partial [Melioribacteraceae bacterium]|nr:hypothetical protein [Melioribacteraceae bacterium]
AFLQGSQSQNNNQDDGGGGGGKKKVNQNEKNSVAKNIGDGMLGGLKSTWNGIASQFTVKGYLESVANTFTGGAYSVMSIGDAAVEIAQNLPQYTADDYQYGLGFTLEKALEILILKKLSVSGVALEGQVAKGSTNAFTYTKSAGKHLTEVVTRGANKGQLARPYMNSPLTIQEIMSTGKGTLDATFKGGMNWRVPGTFRGSQGVWELGINPKTNVIYHFNFTHP